MTITQIHYFVEAARQMNFTKAAANLFVVQQVVSRQIKALEEELGFPLFYRDPGTLRLTKGGKILYSFWSEMLEVQEETLIRASREMEHETNVFRIGTLSVSRILDMLAHAISMVSQEDENIQFYVECASYRELRHGLENRQLDCIISPEDENYGMSGEYEKQILFNMDPHLIIATHHPLYHPGVQIRELADSTLYILSSKFSIYAKKNILEYCRLSNVTPKHIQYFDDFNSLELALSSGNGYALIFPEYFRDLTGNLASIPLQNVSVVKTIGLAVTYRKDKKPRLQPLIRQLLPTPK